MHKDKIAHNDSGHAQAHGQGIAILAKNGDIPSTYDIMSVSGKNIQERKQFYVPVMG